MGLRVMSAKKQFNISANFSGKLKTAFTLPICGILFARPIVQEMTEFSWVISPLVLLKRWVHTWPYFVFEALIWLMVGVTILSFFDYIGRYMWSSQLHHFKNDKQKARKAMLALIPNSISISQGRVPAREPGPFVTAKGPKTIDPSFGLIS